MSIDAGSDVAWVATCNDIIFLDIGEDRYFRLEEPANADALARIAADGSKFWAQPQFLPRPAGWKPAATSAFPLREGKFSLSGIAAAMWLERRLAARLARTGLKRTLASVRTLLDSTQSDKAHIAQAPLIANDFHQAHLLRSAAEQCLIRSLAMAVRCASFDIRSHVVIGIRTYPFAAHCWCQIDGMVLNDTVEEVRRFTPILVI